MFNYRGRNFGEEIGYTQGAGITYNVEFDTFKELIQIIFSGKNKKDKEKPEEKKEDNVEQLTPDFINIKSKNDSKGN